MIDASIVNGSSGSPRHNGSQCRRGSIRLRTAAQNTSEISRKLLFSHETIQKGTQESLAAFHFRQNDNARK
jgi:hypothetical protein